MPLQLAFEDLGDGPPVAVLHGLFGSSRNWRGIARALSAEHRVICVDLRNHGRSPWIGSMTYSEMAADVRALIRSERLDRPVVIGHSMGGKTAMTLALESPELVGRLIAVDIAPVSYADRLTPYVEAMLSIDPRTTADRAEAMRQMSEKIPDATAVAFLMQNLAVRNDHFDWQLNLPAIGAAIPELCAFPAELAARRLRRAGDADHRIAVRLRDAGRQRGICRAVPPDTDGRDRWRRPLGPRRSAGRVSGCAGAGASHRGASTRTDAR